MFSHGGDDMILFLVCVLASDTDLHFIATPDTLSFLDVSFGGLLYLLGIQYTCYATADGPGCSLFVSTTA